VFLGEYRHSLDAKGRIILPSKFRGLLAEGCVLTKGQDSCLAVYPKDFWEQQSMRLREASQSDRDSRDFRRVWYAAAVEEEPDKQGRVTVPEHLRRYANLERDVAVIGVGDFAEIWASEAWDRHLGEAERKFSELSKSNPELPF
jgi:MraZ protein